MKRDSATDSFWQKTSENQPLENSHQTDFQAIIIGAGITGATLALALQQNGVRCLLIDMAEPGFGTTGGTTAHINNFFDSPYNEIISNFGEDQAKVLSDAAQDVVSKIKSNVDQYQIDCDFATCKFYLFSAEEKQDKMLEDIHHAHQKVGILCRYVDEIPFTLPFRKAIEIDGQAQFHPIKYINALIRAFRALGGETLFGVQVENYSTKNEAVTVVSTDGQQFTTKDLVWATHYAPGNNRFNATVAPYRSYAMTVKLADQPEQMAQTADLYDPYHYVRYHKSGDDYFLIAGGFDHKTGHEEDTESCFAALQHYVDGHFKYAEPVARWSSQYYVPADGLPYIGRMPGEDHIYLSTGYNGNGMTFGTMASMIIPDLINGKSTPLSDMLSPSRIKPVASAKSVVTENADAVYHMVKDRFQSEKIEELDELKPGEGKIIKYQGETLAAYRGEDHQIQLLSPICTHAGCTVLWNDSEKSWDCPCHGSRFATDGSLLVGPAQQPLKKIES